MARHRKKKGRPVSGWIVFDKPEGMGSTEAVSKMKWLFNAEKAGHAGTLDPLASGMLPIALGEATKTVPYVVDGGKTYRFTVAWGAETTTDDREGPVTRTSAVRPERAAIEALLPRYTGVIAQVPPQFSAIKINGERAYDIARDGQSVEIAAREVEINRIAILDHDGETTTFEVDCGKGTYVRSLARDFGRDLGCFGHIAMLRRVEVAPFAEADLVSLETLEAARARGHDARDAARDALGLDAEAELPIGVRLPDRFVDIDAMLLDPGAALGDMPEVPLAGETARRLRLGNPVIIRGQAALTHADEAFATERGVLIAIGSIENGEFRPRRVFNAKAA